MRQPMCTDLNVRDGRTDGRTTCRDITALSAKRRVVR